VAGLGARLLSATKEQPKEMLPVFAADEAGILCLKPMVQEIFEHLFEFGVREFYFIVGRRKRAVQDHFAPDHEFVHRLKSQGKDSQALRLLESFYRKVEASTIVWVNQPEPKGFGDAVLQAERLTDDDSFLVQAGDTHIISTEESVHARLAKAHMKNNADATLTIREVEDPRQYGVADILEKGGTLEVKAVVEKPDQPRTRLAIMPVYVFTPTIFSALRATKPGKGGEIQLTDAIQELIDRGRRVQAIKLAPDDIRLDIGTPESYWEALQLSHRYASSKKTAGSRP
jgi:UTP--glucose-1-phosphate uridylyltransferase